MSTRNMNGSHLDSDEAHQHFMRVVYQVNNIACLFQQNEGGFFRRFLSHRLFRR